MVFCHFPLAVRASAWILFFLLVLSVTTNGQEIHLRYNQMGYFPAEEKILMIMSTDPVAEPLEIHSSSGDEIYSGMPARIESGLWGNFSFQYTVDLTHLRDADTYSIIYEDKPIGSIKVSDQPYASYSKDLLTFMRQQRCGYNPYFDVVCHQRDGKLFYGPVADSLYFDFTGGWHDAGDQLKYLITSSNATARMLLAYRLFPDRYGDEVDAMGHPYPNGIPDILDEAKWGLDWILKLHPREDWLIHQIADDRDHRGFKIPDEDNADYGWGPNSYRPAYFADGNPQGLNKWKSTSTGISNLAGRCAATLAMGAAIFKDIDEGFSARCGKAAVQLFEMGENNPGYQQGNSYGAPYRYNEDSWHDDMEWGAAELYRLTGEKTYLDKAVLHAREAGTEGWMVMDTMDHYQKYPFMNMGHYALFMVAPSDIRDSIVIWYRQGIENVLDRASGNAYSMGVPFIWCSNNLLVNFITQIALYEKMTGDIQYRTAKILHRDWLFGRNPWGTSMFTGIPLGGESPEDVHLPSTSLQQRTPAGGLVDGPVYRSIFDSLLGLTLFDPDEFEDFQNDYVIYHDDIGDYSTNEPTMDGTADSILMWALLGD